MRRIYYYDFLRIICTVFIVYYHMLIQLTISGICSEDTVCPFYSNGNMHIATLAVFFMLSGACLTCGSMGHFSVGKYYVRRAGRIFIPYYIASALACIVRAVKGHSLSAIIPEGMPKWRILYSFLGLDAWVAMHGFQTLELPIGEWASSDYL